MNNPKCPYCGGEMEMRFRHRADGTIWKGVVDPREIPYDAVVTYADDNYHYYCRNCKVNTPYRNTSDAAYAAAMKRDRAKGKWITDYCAVNGHSDIYCSVCNKDATYFVGSSDEIHWSEEYPAYCPNCGAEMREEAKDER